MAWLSLAGLRPPLGLGEVSVLERSAVVVSGSALVDLRWVLWCDAWAERSGRVAYVCVWDMV